MTKLADFSLPGIDDQVLPLSEAARAHERMEHSQHMGKIVLRIHD